MPVTFKKGDLFAEGAHVIVNAVNTQGVMGAGIALAFKRRFPLMFQDYLRACVSGELRPGKIHTFRENGVIIVNLPTKDYLRNNSRLIEDADARIEELEEHLNSLGAYDGCHTCPNQLSCLSAQGQEP